MIDPTPTGVRIRLRVQPRASRTEIAGVHGDSLRVRVTVPPVGGAANEALVRFLAERLAVPRGAVRLAGGESGRAKVVIVDGIGPAEAWSRLMSY